MVARKMIASIYQRLVLCFLSVFYSEEYVLLKKIQFANVTSIVPYGANNLCARLICLSRAKGIEIRSVVDRKANSQSFKIQGVEVVNSVPAPADFALVICAVSAQKQILSQYSEKHRCIALGSV